MNQRRRRWERSGLLSRVDRRVLVRVLTIGLSAFLVGYALTALLFFRGGSRPEVVTVPDLRDQPVSEARRDADRLGLELEVGDSLPHPRVRAGAVLTQSPLPGSEVGPGSAVRVIVSSGRDRRAVPDVDSLPRQHAERILTGAGFGVTVSEVPDLQPAGRVLQVQPVPGTVVQIPATVQLVISSGPPMTEVPALVGLFESEARGLIEAAGLQVGEVRYERGGFWRPGEVLSQFPIAGDSLPAGSEIEITVAGARPTRFRRR